MNDAKTQGKSKAGSRLLLVGVGSSGSWGGRRGSNQRHCYLHHQHGVCRATMVQQKYRVGPALAAKAVQADTCM
ncbi:hypothetical protein P7K49_029813 [Saguinus oedipus]|uniref:Uncharacterized protein n=1 Tax=Saguinus oedipus TaxID=9490 RepID=A0ABQ9U892_SAGOE|nr:hypothetical protein P7K49_029813 [Saguinus oedipus]